MIVLALFVTSCGAAAVWDRRPTGQLRSQASEPPITTDGPAVGDESMEFPITNFAGMKQVASNAYPKESDLPYDVPMPSEAGPPLAVWVSEAELVIPLA